MIPDLPDGFVFDPVAAIGFRLTQIEISLTEDHAPLDIHRTTVFPGGGNTWYEPGSERICGAHMAKVGPLKVATFFHYDSGAKHVEMSVLPYNGESETPVGDIKGTIHINIKGPGKILTRAAVPYSLLPIGKTAEGGRYSLWKMRCTHIPAGVLVPFTAAVSWSGEYNYDRLLLEQPQHIRRAGTFVYPHADMDAAQIESMLREATHQWFDFQRDTSAHTNEATLWEYSEAVGQSGDQPRLGKHPLMPVSHPMAMSHHGADYHRNAIMWVEGRRRYWYDGVPLLPGDHPYSAYFFNGLHWTSNWTAGYVLDHAAREFHPNMGDYHGVEGHNLEHLRSTLPEIAYYTQDPALMWMTNRLATCIMDTFHDGYYFGGGFSSLRAWLRPLNELLECAVALDSCENQRYSTEAYWDRIEAKVHELAIRGFSKMPTEEREAVYGDMTQPIVELWQMGMGDFLYTVFLLKGWDDALALIGNLQTWHNLSWKGDSAETVEMPKYVRADDPTLGRDYDRRHDFLVGWNRSLLDIPDVPGVDQDRRKMLVEAIDLEYPDAKYGKWGNGDWSVFEPLKTYQVIPYFATPIEPSTPVE